MDIFTPYASTIFAVGVLAAVQVLQQLVADFVAIRRKHEPGMPACGGHDDLLFRSSRAFANSVENTGVFLLVLAFAVLRGTDPTWVDRLVWVFVAGRAGHMLCYWFDVRLARSLFFTLGLLAVIGLLALGFLA